MLIVTGLRYKNDEVSRCSFYEVMRAHIYHDPSSRIDLGVELLLDLLDGLYEVQLAFGMFNGAHSFRHAFSSRF
jgi:hypothetical protein